MSSTKDDDIRMGSVATSPPAIASPRVMSPTKADPKLLTRLSTLDMMSINQNKTLSVRDRIREMHALKLAPFPVACRRESTVVDVTPVPLGASFPCCAYPSRSSPADTTLHLDLHGLSWKRRHIPTNEILGAAASSPPSQFVVHYVEKHPRRVFRTVHFEAESEADAAVWVASIQTIVKWHARVPLDVSRRVQVVLDTTAPGSATAWAAAQSFLSLASIDCTVVASEDVVSFGQTLPVGGTFEACLVVGNNLSFHRVVNGIFQQPEARWRALLPSLPLGLLLSTDDDANAAVLYNLIKRKIRPRHAVACHFNKEFVVLATDSVALGQTAFSVASHGSMPSVQYQCKPVASDVSSTKTDSLDDDDPNVNLQHHAELCSVYNDIDPALKMWKGTIECNQDVENEPASRTTPLIGLHLSICHRHQAMAVQQFTPGSVWHRWTQHHRAINPFSAAHHTATTSFVSSLVLALPHAWDVSIDASPTRLVSGHVQLDCLPHLLHCFM